MQVDGGTLYPQIETQLPSFIQNDHSNFAKFIEKYYEFLELNLITFNDLDLNEEKPIQESANVTHTVTVATGNNSYSNNANKFYVGGTVSADVTLNTGTTYIFNQSDSTNEGHYLRISTTPDGFHTAGGAEYSNSEIVTISGTPGTAGAQTVITISPDLANSYLYYFCNNHSGMGGSVSIANTTPYITLEQPNTKFNLQDRIKSYDNEKQNQILVEIDRNKFTQQDFMYIQQLSEILDDSTFLEEDYNEKFEVGNLQLTITNIETYEKDLIICKKQ